MEDIFIYGLRCPNCGQIMYVGKAIDPMQRLQEHIAESQQRRKTRKEKWIASLLDQGLTPAIVAIDICSLHNWRTVEQKWISHYESLNPDLCNTKGTTRIPPSPKPPEQLDTVIKPAFMECLLRLQEQNQKRYTWSEIGTALGMSKQGARNLFTKESDSVRYSTLSGLLNFFANEGLRLTVGDLLPIETVAYTN